MIAGVIALCVQPSRTKDEPEEVVNHYWLWKKRYATTYAERQMADTLMRIPKIRTTL